MALGLGEESDVLASAQERRLGESTSQPVPRKLGL
jgi:hypothetical protein